MYYGELQPLFHIDPYLLRLFVLKTDIYSLSSLFERLPLSLVIMRLAKDCFYNIKVRSVSMFMYAFTFIAMYIYNNVAFYTMHSSYACYSFY